MLLSNKGTANYQIQYGKRCEGLTAYADADWGFDPVTCHSIFRYLIYLARSVIFWNNKAQKTIALFPLK